MITRQDVINNEYQNALEMRRPFIQLKPHLFADGDKWCALYGPDIQTGVSGWGDTPEQAASNFDIEWLNSKTPKTSRDEHLADAIAEEDAAVERHAHSQFGVGA